MMKKLWIGIISCFLLVTLIGCTANENKQTDHNQDEKHEEQNQSDQEHQDDESNNQNKDAGDSKSGAAPEPDRPQTKKDTIGLEGSDYEFNFHLIEAEGLGFYTYVIEDLSAETVSSGEGDALVVQSNFGGVINPEATLTIFSPSAANSSTLEEFETYTLDSLKSAGYEIHDRLADAPNQFALSEKEFNISRKDQAGNYYLGTVSLFQRNHKLYSIITSYPEDYSEGFGPRVSKLIEDIVWYDQK